MGTGQLEWLQLAIGYSLFLIPVLIFYIFRTGLVTATLVAAVRMTLQLLFVGFYLEVIFELDHPALNTAWLAVMVMVAGFTILRRSELRLRYFLLPVFSGLIAGLSVTIVFLLILVLQLPDPATARYLIPLSGMILGNCLNTSIVGLRSWKQSLDQEKELYLFYLSCGATITEAMNPFITKALKDAFQPSVASIATIGLISLPGMMTGQILGGSNPITAIQYQILIMIGILTATTITVTSSILIAKVLSFDAFGMMKSVESA